MIKESLNSLLKKLPEEAVEVSNIDTDIGAFQVFNNTDEALDFSYSHDKTLVHYFFSTGKVSTIWAEATDEIAEVNSDSFIAFTHPFHSTTISIKLEPGARLVSFMISLKQLHNFFGSGFGSDKKAAQEFIEGYKMKRFFIEKPTTPAISILAFQFFSGVSNSSIKALYQKGKIMEFFSYYLDTSLSDEEVIERCPFVRDSFEVEKIKKAREIMVDNMIDPPSLKELAKQVGTNEFRLKVGFKSTFGNTVYGYLNDYRMEKARELLTLKSYQIKEVAAEIGYSNPSHFIAAYKKKYGITPKKHLLSL